MRVLAASFPDDDSARAARGQLINALRLDEAQVSVEALAAQGQRADAAVLAGRFQEDVVPAALAVVQEFGGTIVVDIDDQGGNA